MQQKKLSHLMKLQLEGQFHTTAIKHVFARTNWLWYSPEKQHWQGLEIRGLLLAEISLGVWKAALMEGPVDLNSVRLQ